MSNIRRIVQRESRCAWDDFVHRLRVGLIGTAIILFIWGIAAWLSF